MPGTPGRLVPGGGAAIPVAGAAFPVGSCAAADSMVASWLGFFAIGVFSLEGHVQLFDAMLIGLILLACPIVGVAKTSASCERLGLVSGVSGTIAEAV